MESNSYSTSVTCRGNHGIKRQESSMFNCIHNENKFRTNKQVGNKCREIHIWMSVVR
jgi:hypothetical protein